MCLSGPRHNDEGLLRQLRRAREASPPDSRREIEVEAQLLARYDPWLQRIAEGKVGVEAAGEIVNRTLESLARRLRRDLDLPKELWRIALDHLDGDIKDYWRVAYRVREREPVSLDHPDGVPQVRPEEKTRPAEDETLTAEAVELREDLTGSSDSDIRLLGLRLFAGLSPQQIADQLGKSRPAIDTALSRAVAKVRARESGDVRDRKRRAEG